MKIKGEMFHRESHGIFMYIAFFFLFSQTKQNCERLPGSGAWRGIQKSVDFK